MTLETIAFYYIALISVLAVVGVTIERHVQKSNRKASTKRQASYNQRGQ